MAGERLSKFLARCGAASRRKSEELIASCRVRVNGSIVTDPSQEVSEEQDTVTLDGEAQRPAKKLHYIALYKPTGYLSDLADPRGRKIARDLIDLHEPLFPVGRLDYNSEGLMIFTNDGQFANRIMHPRFEVEKEYLVKLSGTLTREELHRVAQGVRVEREIYSVKSISLLRRTQKNAWYRITIIQGKNRMIRRIAEAMSHPVLKLKRVRIDGVGLGALKPGEYRFIDRKELRSLLE